MALFKIFRGDKAQLPTKKHDGYAYFCADTGDFFIDVDLKTGGVEDLQRVQLNALAATKLKNDTKTIEIDDIVLTSDTIVKYDGADGKKLTLNAVLVGNGDDGVKVIPATLGAFFVDTDGGAPQFNVLPVAAGGLGAGTLESGGILQGNGTNAVTTVSGTGVLYAATKGAPEFGVAPITVGGTGANTAAQARTNLDIYSQAEVKAEIKKATTVSYPHTLVVASWLENPDGGYVSTWSQPKLNCGNPDNEALVPPEITFTSNRDEYNKIKSAVAERGVGIKFYTDVIPTEDIGIIIIDQM